MNKIEILLNKPCYVIDMLPKKVPADSEGCFFDVESCFLEHGGQDHFRNKLAAILLKLMCYYPVSVFSYNDGRLTDRPTPQTVADLIVRAKDTLGILFGEDTLFLLEQDCLTVPVYNPDHGMREILSSLVQAEGLFWWKSDQ